MSDALAGHERAALLALLGRTTHPFSMKPGEDRLVNHRIGGLPARLGDDRPL